MGAFLKQSLLISLRAKIELNMILHDKLKKSGSFFLLAIVTVHLSISCSNNSESKINTEVSGYSKDTAAIGQLFEKAKKFISDAQYDSAQAVILTYKNKSEAIHYQAGIAKAYQHQGLIASRTGSHHEAVDLFNHSMSIFRTIKDDKKIASLFNNLSIEYKDLSRNDKALMYADSCINLSTSLKDSFALSRGLNSKANILSGNGQYANASTLLVRSLEISGPSLDSNQYMVTLTNLANVYFQLKDYNKAIALHLKALEYNLRSHRNNIACTNYGNLGLIYRSMHVYDSAVYFFYKELAMAKEIKNPSRVASSYFGFGKYYLDIGNTSTAISYSDSAYQMYVKLEDKNFQAHCLKLIGDAFYKNANGPGRKKDIYTAIKYYQQYLGLGTEEDHEVHLLDGNLALARAYNVSGDYQKAYEYLFNYTSLSDSLRSEKYTGQIAEMQTKYETSEKEIEITKLNSEKLLDAEKLARQKTMNVSLLIIASVILFSGIILYRNIQKKSKAEKQVAILEKQNAIENMRGKIASDVHDDMGANLTKIGLNAQQLLSKLNDDEQKKLAEKIASQSIEVTTGMREIIWASNPANDNLKSMLGFMRQYIDRFFDGTNIRPVVNFPHDMGEVTLHPEVRRNLFLILKESLNNAVKYSGTDKVDIDFSNENEKFNLNIKDYGKGIDHKNNDDFSNGIRNMKMRAEQIQSAFSLITSSGNGVLISVKGKLY